MATYVVSDIHGQYDMFISMLEKICFSDDDLLYVLGDVVDRGPYPCRVLLKMMEMPNVIPIIGNHEMMALPCLRILCQDITEESIKSLDENTVADLQAWIMNGAESTIRDFRRLDKDSREAVLDYLGEFSCYEEVTVGGRTFLLIHGGLKDFYPGKDFFEYTVDDIVWSRHDYETRCFPDKYVITGHTPTQYIDDNENPGYIFRKNGNIDIDCGCNKSGGRLAAICLDTDEEFYVERNENGGLSDEC